MHKSIPYAALVAVFLLGFAVLSNQLDSVALWADEGWTINATNESNPVVTVRDWVAVDVHPPLFFIGLDGWRLFTGDSIFELRYYSLLISMLGIALAFRLGKSLYSTRAGVLAALFYALHDLVKVLTQEVRHYPQQLALTTLVLWVYWRFWKQPTTARGVVFVLSGTALLYTHYWGGFVLFGLAVHLILTRRTHIRSYFAAFVAIAVLYLPWVPTLISQITMERPGGLPHALPNSSTVYAVLTYQLIGIPELFWVLLAFAGLIGVFTLQFTNLRDLWAKWQPTPATLLPLPYLILTPALSILLNEFYPTLSFRSLAVVIPGVIVLAAHGLSRFKMPEQAWLIAFVVLYSLSLTGASALQRAPWQEIADFATNRATDADVILLENDTDSDPMAYYVSQAANPTDFAFSERVRETDPRRYGLFLDETLEGREGVWVTKLGWPALDGDVRPDLEAMGFVSTAPEIDYGTYLDEGGMFVWRYDRPPEGNPIRTYTDPETGDSIVLNRADAEAHSNGVTVNLLWSTPQTPTQDVTVSAFVLDASGAFANRDSVPLDGRSSVLTWTADGYYFDSHLIDTAALPPGEYNVGVAVYTFTDQTFTEIRNLQVDDCRDAPDDCRFIFVDTVTVGE